MFSSVMNFLAEMFEKPVNAGPAKEYAFVFDYWDMWENQVSVKTQGRDTMTFDTVFDSYLLDWNEEADSLS